MYRVIILGLVLSASIFFFPDCAVPFRSAREEPSLYGTSPRFVKDENLREFRAQVNQIINYPAFNPATMGIHVEEYGTNKILYSLNPHKLLIPASNMKLFTTASALAMLGPQYTYQTSLHTDGIVRNDTLLGNLYIRGSGDPTISGRHNNGKPLEIFYRWSDIIKSKGIAVIEGSIIGDDNCFDDIELGYSWGWDDLSYYYAAKINGLSFNDNCVDIFIMPADSIAGKARIVAEPVPNYLSISNELVTVSADSQNYIDFYRIPGSNEVRIFGTVKLDADTLKDWITIANPTHYFLKAFQHVLDEDGITVRDISDIDNTPLQKPSYDRMDTLAVHQSVPMAEIIRTVNKVSQNFYAEQLQKTLGIEQKKEGSTQAGIAAEKDWLAQIGINPEDIFIVDGSGLSRHNMVTAFQVVQVLKAMRQHSDYQIFFDSLPIGGVDGTLKSRLKGSNAQGHVHAKTGYVGHVRALSGYVITKNGREYLFSILVNHYPVPTRMINQMQDAIVTLLYNLDY